MRPSKCILLFILCLASTGQAQRAVLIKLPSGAYVGIYIAKDGTQTFLTQVTVVEMPDPPPPLAKIKHTMLLIESGDVNNAAAILIAGIRNDPALSKKVTILDPDTEDENGNPDPQVKAALKIIGDASLPCVVGFDGDGKPTVFAPILKTAKVDVIKAQLKKWGL